MPLEDVVSPVIAAFLAGRKIKQDKERFELQKRQEDDESKIRQQQAQKLSKEIAHFDKNAELEDQIKKASIAIAQNNLKHSFLTDVAEGRRKVPQIAIEAAREAAMTGDWNDELATPGMQGMLNRTPTMGIPENFDIGGGVMMNRGELVSPEEMTATKVANAAALQGVKTAAQKDLLGQKFIADKALLGIKEEGLDRRLADTEDHQVYLAGINNAAKDTIARLQAKTSRDNNIRATGTAKEVAQMRIDAAGAVDEEDIEDAIKTNIQHGTLTQEGIRALGLKFGAALSKESAKRELRILTNKQDEDLQGVVQLGNIRKRVAKLVQAIGNGGPTGIVPGSELYQEYESIKSELGQLARRSGNVGSLSDNDINRTLKALPSLMGLNLRKHNEEKLNNLDETALTIFNHYYPPKVTNDRQRMNVAKKLGIPLERIQY